MSRLSNLRVHVDVEATPIAKSPIGNPIIISKRDLMERLINQARDLKMLPGVAAKAIQLADDPDSNISELADVISHDPKLTISLLRLSNSSIFPGYASRESISCVRTAVTRLGFRQTKQMVLIACFSNMAKRLEGENLKYHERLYQHCFLTASLCTRINRLLGLGMMGDEFTAGLLHDVGRILLAVSIPEKFEQLDELSFEEDELLLDRENLAMGTTHTEIGAWFLSRNQMSDELITVARFHHRPGEASRFTRLVGLVNVADSLANCYQMNSPIAELDADSIPGVILLESLGVLDAREKIRCEKESLVEQSIEDFNLFASL